MGLQALGSTKIYVSFDQTKLMDNFVWCDAGAVRARAVSPASRNSVDYWQFLASRQAYGGVLFWYALQSSFVEWRISRCNFTNNYAYSSREVHLRSVG